MVPYLGMRKVVAHVRKNVRNYGVEATLHDIGYRLVNKLVEVQILKAMAVRLEDVKDPGLFRGRGFEVRFIGEDELAGFARAGAHGLSDDFLRGAGARGDRCCAVFDGAALVSYGWYSNLPTPLDEHFVVHFDPAYTYMYKGYTVPAYRGRRLHAVGICHALRTVTREGKRGLIATVHSNNFASLRSVAHMGYRIFGEVYLLRFGGHCFGHATRTCREFGFEIHPARPP